MGRIARLPLRLIPRRQVVRVRSGLNKGLRWRVGSATHGCWLGHYEPNVQRCLPDYVKQGIVCYDIGANAGFYSLALARLVGPTGRVIAFEPLAENAASLLFHIRLNGFSNVSLVQAAVGDSDSLVPFETHQSTSMGKVNVGANTDYFMPSARLDTVITRDHLPGPSFIKMDVEGGEVAALRGARNILQNYRPTILVAIHGTELFVDCMTILNGHRYTVFDLGGKSLCAECNPVDEMVAIPPMPASAARSP